MIQSNADQFKALKDNPNDEPVVMLNLLKFKPDGGFKTYLQYMRESNRYVEGLAARSYFSADPTSCSTAPKPGIC